MTAAAICVLFALPQGGAAEALSAEALRLVQQNRQQDAEQLWKKALALNPKLFSANFNLGFLLQSQSRHQQAEPFLARAAQTRPKDFNARYLLGATLAQLGRGDDALRQWRVALQLQPRHAKLMQIMAVEYGKGRYFREAAEIAKRALNVDDSDANLHLIAIKSFQDANDDPGALEIAGRMIRKFPEHPRAQFEYGYELHRAARGEESLPYLTRAMEMDPYYEEPFFFYGEVLLKEGRNEEALVPLRRAIAIRRDYIAAWYMLGRALMALGHLDEARAELLKAIEIDPRHPQPHLLLSQLYFRLGEEEAAAREKDLSLRLRRENPGAMETPQARPFPARK
jgi:tetratricopeptide (TPR) repeat protein